METQEIMQAVEKQLPSMVGEQLRKRLELADKAEALQKENAKLDARLNQTMEERALAIKRADQAEQRLAGIEKRERDLELALARFEAQKQAAEDRVQFARDTLHTVFKNREIVQRFSGDVVAGVSQPSQYNSYASPQIANIRNETTTSEE